MQKFPPTLRRSRNHNWMRSLNKETTLTIDDFILPIFVIEGFNIKEEIPYLKGNYYYSIDQLLLFIEELVDLSVKAIILFPVVEKEKKDLDGVEAYNSNNLICRTIRAIKETSLYQKIGIITDIALDPYTTHGHDGIIGENNIVDNHKTVQALCKQSLVIAEAGCHALAPSDMMDGRVEAMRSILNQNNYNDVLIISYSAKYKSNLYDPFRNTVGSKQTAIDKSTYQLDYHNKNEAEREVEQDIKEGADSIIIKPGLFYLDIIRNIKVKYNIPLIAYQVSGEYKMLMSQDSYLIMYEALIALKRAGADSIISYYTYQFAKNLNDC
ncbi:MAG: porphobilinogen synthase [Anaplasmataceae bacterium]|nr:porphobilinogen synthase [Anaplasmataceae bacterium]